MTTCVHLCKTGTDLQHSSQAAACIFSHAIDVMMQSYLDIRVEGEGQDPALRFSVRECILPAVSPLH